MKEYIKSYHMFLPSTKKLFLLGLYLLYPLAMLGMTCLFNYVLYNSFISLLSVGTLVLSIECLLDYFTFEGIQSGKVNYLDYIKTSYKGRNMIYKALRMDAIRRIIAISVIIVMVTLAANYGVATEARITLMYAIQYGAGICFFAQVVIVIARFFQSIWVYICISYLAGCVFLVAAMYAQINRLQIVFTITWIIGYIICIVIGYIFSRKGVEGSYYDK